MCELSEDICMSVSYYAILRNVVKNNIRHRLKCRKRKGMCVS